MVKLFFDSGAAAETLSQSPLHLTWQDPAAAPTAPTDQASHDSWASVKGLEDQQRRFLQRLQTKGVFWKNSSSSSSSCSSEEEGMVFRLTHGGEVDADGNCLFTATARAMGPSADVGARELRRRAVTRFLEEYGSATAEERKAVDEVIRHLYSPDLNAGWGIHVVQEVRLLAAKSDRLALDSSIQELLDLGLQRENAAESIYKERCVAVKDGASWAKYMSVSGLPEDEFDIITLQYTEEGLLFVDENRSGHAPAFGDDIAIGSLATEFKSEIYVVQAHGSDAMVDEDNCVFFLPHRPRCEIFGPPFFLFMKGTGWCGGGGDHYEPLIAHPVPHVSQEKAAVVL